MRIDIITIFPKSFDGPLSESMIGRARAKGLVGINIVDLRDFTEDKRRTVDDTPYGGGPGMLMKPEPLFKAVEALRSPESVVILTTPRGELFTQEAARRLVAESHLIIICGHYEGVDERVREALVDCELSIGDFILTNGCIPAMAITDAVTRLLPGVLGGEGSAELESFSDGLLEHPQYTRPPEFRGMRVPDVLVSGDHKKIEKWRREASLAITMKRRPDLIEAHLGGGAAGDIRKGIK